MKRSVTFAVAAILSLASTCLLASDEAIVKRAAASRVKSAGQAKSATADVISFSAQVPIVARVQGTAFFRTSIDINNNTQNTITAQFQLSYTCVATTCSPVGGFYNTAMPDGNPPTTITLAPLSNFHQDDLIDYLNGLGLLQPGAEQGTIGTFLVNFFGVTGFGPGNIILGSEATVVGRTYNHLDEGTPSSATVGFAYNASLFFESADGTLVGTARDTKSAPSEAGLLRSNVGIYNTDANITDQPVTVVLSFYDVKSGQLVGNKQTFTNLQPGELRQISDLWATAAIPSTVNQVVIFVDNASSTSTTTFEGYVTIIDGQAASTGSTSGLKTQDASYFEMHCSNGCD